MLDTDSPLWALTYVSHATRELAEEELGSLLASAKHFNTEHALTGFLAYETSETGGPGLFVQRLEGLRSTVSRTFSERIEPAAAHRDIVIRWQGTIPRRSYSDWSMAYGRWRGDRMDFTSDLAHRLAAQVVVAPLGIDCPEAEQSLLR